VTQHELIANENVITTKTKEKRTGKKSISEILYYYNKGVINNITPTKRRAQHRLQTTMSQKRARARKQGCA
jgi:hypothetical protein